MHHLLLIAGIGGTIEFNCIVVHQICLDKQFLKAVLPAKVICESNQSLANPFSLISCQYGEIIQVSQWTLGIVLIQHLSGQPADDLPLNLSYDSFIKRA